MDEVAAATSLSASDSDLVNQAIAVLTTRCMNDLGYSYSSPVSDLNRAGYPTGYPSEQQLQERGYGWNEPLLEPMPVVESSDAERALNGTCGPQVAADLGLLDWGRSQQVLSTGVADAINSVISDERYISALQEWVACMAQLGYQYETPQSAKAAAQSALGGYQTAESVALAIVDYGCRHQNRLLEIRIEIQNEVWREWLDANPQAVTDASASSSALIANAVQAVAAG